MTIEELSALFNWENFKKLKLPMIGGAILFLYNTWLRPSVVNDVKDEIHEELVVKLRTEITKDVLAEWQANDLSLELKLSNELGVPLYKIPLKIGETVHRVDSAEKYTPLIRDVEYLKQIKPIGLVLQYNNVVYYNHKGERERIRMNEKGFYKYDKDGKVKYVYYF